MTIIAWDGATLAADKRMTTPWGAHDTVTKIERHGDALLAITGTAAAGLQVSAWWKAGATPGEFPADAKSKDETCTFIVFRAGSVLQFTTGPVPTPLEDGYLAFGSGRDFAIAAMHCGRTARQAAELTCQLSVHCGNGIDTLTLET